MDLGRYRLWNASHNEKTFQRIGTDRTSNVVELGFRDETQFKERNHGFKTFWNCFYSHERSLEVFTSRLLKTVWILRNMNPVEPV